MFKRQDLVDLARTTMPFGKYEGYVLIDLPQPYLNQLASTGFPAGRLGQLLTQALAIKSNRLDYLLHPLKLRADKEKSWRIRPDWQIKTSKAAPLKQKVKALV